jgi:hypothetical protein
MEIEQNIWTQTEGWGAGKPGKLGDAVQLVLIFGSRSILSEHHALLDTIKRAYPRANHLGCSTSGEICGTSVSDDSLVVTAIRFDHTKIVGTKIKITQSSDSLRAGEQLAQSLPKDDLRHVFVISDGLHVNASDLAAGLMRHLPPHVAVTGGLSGDGAQFKETLVLWDDRPEQGVVAAVGLYGDRLKVGYGAMGGWDPFGPERLVTRSKGNILFEFDGKSALGLYKNYLGDQAKGLPGTALHFPLCLRKKEKSTSVVRTVLAIDEMEQSMIFAGEVPQGEYARLMRTNYEGLIEGSIGAAKASYEGLGSSSPELAVLISCVGRKLVLKQRTGEEVEGVREIMGDRTALTGFYSYGGYSPFTPQAQCEFHNQSMIITTFSEQ